MKRRVDCHCCSNTKDAVDVLRPDDLRIAKAHVDIS